MKHSRSTLARALLDVAEKHAHEDDVHLTDVLTEMIKLSVPAHEQVVEIQSARDLSATSIKQIKSFLSKKLGIKKLKTKQTVDPSLIGGFIARVGDQEIDFSIRSALKRMRAYV